MANTKITNPKLFNLGDSTSATQLPVMTTTQRTAMTGLSVGEMIFNSTTDKVEYFDGTKWYGITYEPGLDPLILSSVMYYSASDTDSYPGSGTDWFDLSGNSNTATITSSNYSNGYFDLTPTASIITTPVNTLYQTFSYSIWVKFDSVTPSSGHSLNVLSKSQFYASNHQAFPFAAAIGATGTFTNSLSYGNNYSADVTNSTSVSANTWYNIACVIDTTTNTSKLYIGTESTQLALVNSVNYTGTLVSNPNQFYSLGKSPAEYGGGVGKSSMNGKIAKFGFWDTALTEAELITIWGLGSGATEPPWPGADLFGDGSNMFTSDFSNSTPDVIEGNGASMFVDPSFPNGVIGYNSNVPNAGFEKSMVGTANVANQIFGYSLQSGNSITSVKTYSFWVYVTKIDDDDNSVLSTNMKRQNYSQMWQYSWSTAGVAGPIDTFTPVSTNTWHNIVVVDEGTVMRTYLDNVSIGTISIGSNVLLRSSYPRFYHLSDADSRNTQFVTGIRMFDRAVTASEVDTIYNEVPEYT